MLTLRGLEFTQMLRTAMGQPLCRGFPFCVAPLGSFALSAKIDNLGHSFTRRLRALASTANEAPALSPCVMSKLSITSIGEDYGKI